MKPITPELLTHLQSEVTSLATCWKLTRRDALVMGFTSHDCDIIFDGVAYLSANGFAPVKLVSNSDFSADIMQLEGAVDGEVITEADIKAGIYDYAEIEVFMVNYNDLTQGKMSLRTGWLGEMKYGNGRFSAEMYGLTQSFAQVIGELYSPSCRAKLGDARCGLDIADLTVTGVVTGVTSNQIFVDSARTEDAGYFSMGKITFTSGANAGLEMEVKEYGAGGVISLVFPMSYVVEAGDGYSMQAGCDKSFGTCISSFSNAINFRGEPHVPGADAMFKTAGTI